MTNTWSMKLTYYIWRNKSEICKPHCILNLTHGANNWTDHFLIIMIEISFFSKHSKYTIMSHWFWSLVQDTKYRLSFILWLYPFSYKFNILSNTISLTVNFNFQRPPWPWLLPRMSDHLLWSYKMERIE